MQDVRYATTVRIATRRTAALEKENSESQAKRDWVSCGAEGLVHTSLLLLRLLVSIPCLPPAPAEEVRPHSLLSPLALYPHSRIGMLLTPPPPLRELSHLIS